MVSFISINTYSENGPGLSSAEIVSHSRSRADYDFTLMCENNSHVTNGGDPTGYYIDITNTGTKLDTIMLTIDITNVSGGSESKKSDWDGYLDYWQVTLEPNESKTIILTVASTCSCQEGNTATIRVTGESVNAPTVTKYIDTFTLYGPAMGTLDVEIADKDVFWEISAGEKLNFSLNIYNLQSVPQSYIIETTKKPGGFIVEMPKEPILVQEQSVEKAYLQLTIPNFNEPGWYNLSFHIQSDRDSIIEDSVDLSIELLPELAIEKIAPSILAPEPGENVEIKITVRNHGPAIAREFILKVYNDTERREEQMIHIMPIPELVGGNNITVDFNWVPNLENTYDITAYVNPAFTAEPYLKEMANRYHNNLKTLPITVKKQLPKPDGQDGDDDGDDGGQNSDDRKKKETNVDLYGLLIPVIALIVVIVVILVLYYALRVGDSDDEKTAKKIPLNREGRVKPPKSKKRAHKERLTSSEQRQLTRAHSRSQTSGRNKSRRRRK